MNRRIVTNNNNNSRATSSPSLQVLQKKITCSICKNIYTRPKTLPCLHSFCHSCLSAVMTKDNLTQKLECPECQTLVAVEEESTNSFPDAFAINRCITEFNFLQKVHGMVDTSCEKCTGKSVKATTFCDGCGKFICDLCVTIHKSWSEFSSHKLLTLSDLKECYHKYIPISMVPAKCVQHEKECSVYCDTCQREICHECVIRSHRTHQYNMTDDSAKQHKLNMREKLKMIETVPSELDQAISKLSKLVDNFREEGSSAVAKIEQEVKEIEQTVSTRKKALLKEASATVEGKIQLLNDQKSELERIRCKVVSCKDFVVSTTDSDHNSDFFMLKKQMCDRIAEVSQEFSATELTPIEQPTVVFSSDQTLEKHLLSSGSVHDGSYLHVGYSSQLHGAASRNWASLFYIKEVITFYVSLSSSFFRMRNSPADKISAEIRCLRDNSVCPATVAINISGYAKVQCSFAERGRYIFIIKIAGHHVHGSPHTFFVRPIIAKQFQNPIRSITKLSSPKGIVVNHKNQIIVTQESLHNVTVFGKRCRKVLSFGSYGTGEAQFNHPCGVAVDQQDYIYISDSKNNRVQKFDGEGHYVKEYTGRNHASLNQPMGVSVSNGKVFVVDRGNGRIVVLSLDLQYLYSFGSQGRDKGQFEDPWDIAMDTNGIVYITDIKMHTVHVFDSRGEYRGQIGVEGTQKGRLNRPSGIAIDHFGRIFVCEFGNHRVSIFHISSEFVDCFSTGLSMVNPHSITIDEDGFVYVSSAEAVHIF